MVMHQSALPSNVMPLLCGIMLLFTLLRLPIYLSCLVLRFIFFSIRPFLQRDASRSTFSCSETRICLTRIIHTIVYLFVKLLKIYIESRFIFNSKKKIFAREIREMDFWPFDRILLRVLQSVAGQRSFLTGSKWNIKDLCKEKRSLNLLAICLGGNNSFTSRINVVNIFEQFCNRFSPSLSFFKEFFEEKLKTRERNVMKI